MCPAMQDDAISAQQHVLQTRRAADGGALTHGVPVLLDVDTTGMSIDISNHEPSCLVERKNRVVLEA